MDSKRWHEVQRIYAEVVRVDPERRVEWLDEACGGDDALRADVERLLQQEIPEGFLEPSVAEVEGKRLGHFELVRELGRGGMGVVFVAHDERLDRDVALKVLPGGLGTTQSKIDRFQREARAAARLRHPSIVPIYEVGEDSGLHFYSMEFVPEGDLARELEFLRTDRESRLPGLGDPLHVPTMTRLVAEVAEALQHSHEKGIVHRDVKPQNMMLGADMRLRLVDFGLAKDTVHGSLTTTNPGAGTLFYMSPEQASLRGRRRIDHRTDVYSLGVVLYELLTLKRPFRGETDHEVISKIAQGDARPVRKLNPRVPRDLETVCSKAMSHDSRDRYETAGAFAADLRRLLALEAIHARPPSVLARARRHVQSHKMRYAVVASAVSTALVVMDVMRREALSRGLQRELAACEQLENRTGWLTSPLSERVLLGERLANLRARDDLDPSELERVEALSKRLERHLGEILDSAASRIEHGLQTPVGIESFDDAALAEGQMLMAEAVILFGERARARGADLIEATRTPLTVTATDLDGRALTGSVRLRELDPVTGVPGGPRELGRLPLEGVRLRPGYFRIVVLLDDGRFREFSRLVRRGRPELAIDCRFDPAADELAGMVRVDGGTLLLRGEFGTSLTPYQGVALDVPGFHVDEVQVSVGDYRRFLAGTGRGRPSYWRLLEGRPKDPWDELVAGLHDELPMVGVNWMEARDYAEWAGKRLIAAYERDFVGRGLTGRRFPYEVPPGEDPYRGAVEGMAPPPVDEVAVARHYLTSVHPVRSHPEARSEPHGVYHLLGNVMEWTESLGASPQGGDYTFDPGSRCFMGAPWHARALEADLGARGVAGIGDAHARATLGFRCARSIEP